MTIALRLGFDLGVRRLRGALADDTVVAELSEPTRNGSAREIAGQLVGLAARLQVAGGRPRRRAGQGGRGRHRGADAARPAHGDSRACAPACRGWIGSQLGTILERAFGFPVAVENDANAAALAEGRAGGSGAAVGLSDYVSVLIRTGIGHGRRHRRQARAWLARPGGRDRSDAARRAHGLAPAGAAARPGIRAHRLPRPVTGDAHDRRHTPRGTTLDRRRRGVGRSR